MRRYFYKFLFILIFLSTITCLFSGCSFTPSQISKTGFYFDTVISVTIYDSNDETLLDECFKLADKYENMLSRTKEGSDIWNINHAGGSPVSVSKDTADLLNIALKYAEFSDGKVDPTIGVISTLWDFSETSDSVVPDSDILADAVSHVNYKYITISNINTSPLVILSDPLAQIDLGFIAKGFIADRMKDYLCSQGIKSALINLGGNVLTIGSKPNGDAFKVGIQEPFEATGTTAAALPVKDLSVVSSGIYERYFESGGNIYHHILDTKTGYPVRNNLFEVTIISPYSVDGDALSTTCLVLGLEQGMELIESLDGIEALFITDDGALHPSSGLTIQVP